MMGKQLLKDLIKKYYFIVKTIYSTLPLEAVEIETTTICNRKCEYCPNSTVGRKPEKMDDSTFYKIIDSLKKMGFNGRISPHFYGEPLTDSRLVRLMSYASTNLPQAQIKLFTNGDLLTVEKYLELKKAGVGIFRISQHSKEPSETIANTLDHIRKHYPELHTVEYVNYYNEFYENLNSNNFLINRGGTVNVKTIKRPYCYLVNQMTFDYAGNAVLCVNDYNSQMTFGNIIDREIRDIWYDKDYVKARNKIISGNWIFDLCRKCMDY